MISRLSFDLGAAADNALRLAALDVQYIPPRPERVSARAAPIHAVEKRPALAAAVLEVQIAVVAQPRVEIHAAAERAEAVVGEHEQGRLVIDERQRFPDQVVHAAVHLLDHAGVRAPLVQMAEKHVLHAVAGIENAGHDAAAGALSALRNIASRSSKIDQAWRRNASSSITPSLSAQVSSAMPAVA